MVNDTHWIAVTPDHMILNQAEKHLKNAEAFMQADRLQARDEMIRADALLKVVADFEWLRHHDYQDGEQARQFLVVQMARLGITARMAEQADAATEVNHGVPRARRGKFF